MLGNDFMQDKVLDITPLRETGEELVRAIYNAVRDTQVPIMTQLPNILLMTAAQYKDLDHHMINAYKSKDRVYMTPLNAMDVVVKDPQNFDTDKILLY